MVGLFFVQGRVQLVHLFFSSRSFARIYKIKVTTLFSLPLQRSMILLADNHSTYPI
ncbi:hypothetical protein HMPREF1869_00271 [Bacteroidales bacterium KA00251]|nr:hypothetical protein HMPREF1869_00271 [Bacteroidales bacterium KA00251]